MNVLIGVLERIKGIEKLHFRNAGQTAHHDVFDARLRRSGERDGLAITTQSGRDPKHVDLFDWLHRMNVATGSAGALARIERAARTVVRDQSVFKTFCACAGEAPALPVSTRLLYAK